MTTGGSLPHWDVSTIYPSLSSAEFITAFTEAIGSVESLKELFDELDVREAQQTPVDPSSFEKVVAAFNDASERLAKVQSYVSAFTSTDVRNQLAQSRSSEALKASVELGRLNTRLQAWVGSIDLDELVAHAPSAREHEFILRKFRDAARRQMSEAEEDLASGMSATGSSAWSRLYRDVTAQLVVDYQGRDGARRLPMSTVRMMFREADRDVRRAAYSSELEAWATVAVPLAAALNGIKGERNLLNARRAWEDSLEPELFSNNIDRGTFDAMQAACEEALPDMRRYLKTKASLLGQDSLCWWDLGAPVGRPREWTYDAAQRAVVDGYSRFSSGMGDLARRAFDESWIDAEPREGKVDGAFCMRMGGGDSRVLTQFTYTYGSVNSLAHELGHAYHVLNSSERTWLQIWTPMALSETASTFGENVVASAVLEGLTGAERLSVLDFRLASACQQTVDIRSRYVFERQVFEQRERRELSVDELNTLMRDAQRDAYGDALDHEHLHPFLWAAKVHFFGRSYMNWPYTFGLLFALGLYAEYQNDRAGFPDRYDGLLSSTGMADAATLGRRFGIDVSSIDFWRSSLSILRAQIDEFESLARDSVGAARGGAE